MNIKELFKILAQMKATAGDEYYACESIKKIVSPYVDMQIDKLGNLIGCFNPEGKGCKILLDAHIDQVGMIVRGIDDKGFILFDKLGGIDERVLVGSEVIVHGKKNLKGVVCSTPPHLSTSDNETLKATKMAIDIGYDKTQSNSLVQIGDRITFNYALHELLNDNVSTISLDNRAGVATLISLMPNLDEILKNCSVTIQFSSQEEVGCRGAKAAVYGTEPEYAIVVDVGFGYNANCNADETIKLGEGVSIGISPILDRGFTQELVQLAKAAGIEYQHDVMSGGTGTNADNISINGSGVKTALLSIPLRNMHTAVEVVNVHDVIDTSSLILNFISQKEKEYDTNA